MRQRVRALLDQKLELRLPESAGSLTTYEVARFLRVSRWTLSAWRKNGVGPPFVKLSRRTVRYPRRAFERYMRQHLQGGTLRSGTKAADSALQKNPPLLSA
jgi:excisionase family DNA binding protein